MQAPKALHTGLDVDWVFSESCIITWKDDLEPKILGSGTQPVTLWFGTKQANHLWVILLQRTIIFKISDRSVAFDFFMFVDPHSILFEKSPIPTLPNILSPLPKADQGWLSASVHQDQLPSFGQVLMQAQRPNSKPWEGMPLHRLMELKSLSDASEFTVYLVNKKNVRKFVNRLQNELPKTLGPIHIDLSTVYEGRGGAWDAWGPYNDELTSVPGASDSEPLTSHQVAPPIYSKTDPNATYNSRDPSTTPTTKRPYDTQEEEATRKKIRDDRASQWAWHNADYPLGSPTEENTPSPTHEQPSPQATVDDQSVHKGQSRQGDEVTESARSSPNISADDRSTQGHTPSPGLQLAPVRPYTPDHSCSPVRNSFHDLRGLKTSTHASSFASTVSLDRINIKPTIFTTRSPTKPHSALSLTLSELESLITTTIRAQIPLIAAHVQTHNLATELTAWAQPSITDYITTHMPVIMHEAVSAHVSDVNDEFESASAALHETKEDAITEIRAAEESGIQEVHRESQIAVNNLQEQSQRLSDALEDKCTELEDRLEAKISPLAPPEYSRQFPVGVSSAKEAVKVFERFHRGRLTPDEQVRVLLSIAKFSNAEVFMAADLESRRMLVAHWSGRED